MPAGIIVHAMYINYLFYRCFVSDDRKPGYGIKKK